MIENNIAKVESYYNISDKKTKTVTLNPTDNRICNAISVKESEGANFLTVEPYQPDGSLRTLIIECVGKDESAVEDTVYKHWSGNGKEIPRISADAFGYSDWLNSGNCETKLYKRSEAKPTNWTNDDDELIIGRGTFQEGEEEPIFNDEWLDNVEDVELPLNPVFKIYWKGFSDAAIYYRFFIGEEIDLGLIAKLTNDTSYTHIFPEKLVIIKITDTFIQGLGFSVGDKWYIPIYDSQFADGQIDLPDNTVPPSISFTDVNILNTNNLVYESYSQTNHLPIVRTLNRGNTVDKYDYSYSIPNSRIVIHRPEYGGRIKNGTVSLEYLTYDTEEQTPDFIPGELASRKILFNDCYGDYELPLEEAVTILSNSKNHINLRIQPKTNNPSSNSNAPTGTIIQSDDDILFPGALQGKAVSVSRISGQILVITQEKENANLYHIYLINRSGIAVLDVIEADKMYGGIEFMGTAIFAYYKNGIFNIALLGGEIIYSQSYEQQTDVYFTRIDNKVFVITGGFVVCIQEQVTHNYIGDSYVSGYYNEKFYVCTNNTIEELTENERSGFLQTSFNSFGKDGFIQKRLISIKAQYVNMTEETIFVAKDHINTLEPYVGQDYEFRNISIAALAKADALESITVDFEPELDKKHIYVFTVAIHQNVLDLNGERLGVDRDTLDYFNNAPSNQLFEFVDIEGNKHNVTIRNIQTRGLPQAHKEHDETNTDAGMYLATFTLVEE